MEMLADALRENDTVEFLDLKNNAIKVKGAIVVASALAGHPSIARLELVSIYSFTTSLLYQRHDLSLCCNDDQIIQYNIYVYYVV
jgi:hypothetical protein